LPMRSLAGAKESKLPGCERVTGKPVAILRTSWKVGLSATSSCWPPSRAILPLTPFSGTTHRQIASTSRLMRTNPFGRFFSPRLGGRRYGEKSKETQERPRTARPRSFQVSGSQQPSISELATVIRTRHPGLHRLVLFRATARVQQNRGDPLEQRRYAPSTINLRLAAVRRLAYEASDCGLLSPDLAAGIRRVKGAKRLGVRIGNWLSADQSKTLLAAPSGSQLRDLRNRAVLAMLIGCGLRRAEIVTVKVEDFELREEHWVLADLVGKGGHMRTVPVPSWVKSAVDTWITSAGLGSGILFRAIGKTGKVQGSGFTAKVIWSIVCEAASNCGFGVIAPHDLRRTCARLCH
jgi:integrase